MDMRGLRQQVKLTATEVAERLGIVESTVRNWEYGKTIPKLRLDQFIHLLELYETTPSKLLAAVYESGFSVSSSKGKKDGGSTDLRQEYYDDYLKRKKQKKKTLDER